ncbi:hypothetical protein WCX18_00795 [Sulfurimonas sp. HSL1-2]|uniref:hypothetical protein n=1 Tax=Thiomicrolovo zhangzhouensis TaxID=3131933 RepID=UPI0031F74BEF
MDESTYVGPESIMQLRPIELNGDKGIYLLQAFQVVYATNKQYLRGATIIAGKRLITTKLSDTIHLMEELKMFELGNDQNKYFTVSQHKNSKNLKLNVDNKNIFISRSEAKAMYKLFTMSFMGYSFSRLFEYEYTFTPQGINKEIDRCNFLEMPYLET